MLEPDSIDATAAALQAQAYLPSRELATAAFLALRLKRPLLLEGAPGTGKTAIAAALAAALGRPLIRLQCYEGLDLAAAAYEWNYARQMLEIRLAQAQDRQRTADDLFARRFLIERPLLQALTATPAPVLLIDELDRADAPFEAFLLEFLSDFQVTVPEFGTITAAEPPIVVLTSNRSREIHDAVKRRCLYHWVDFPDAARELAIVRARLPGIAEALAAQVVAFVQGLRRLDLYKLPGLAETLDWSRALVELNAVSLDPATVQSTLGVLLKYQDDIARVQGSEAARLLAELREAARA
ncbi:MULTISPECIES: AAA family ATPase [Roseateles]|uniref:MoxR family ATPase n=1 Tax=Pelomonas caseinilytica TaxID=2906763 RepID=A0ABS8XPH5_9BURK|nr:MoxR family ATPase [Roseateles sp.]MCE4540471.1 MoxR family ATPase [Pelomonas sp. P7]HEV6963909.1 MoxR family ATPase [Roseateles sp.]